jgi:hypothetical protein
MDTLEAQLRRLYAKAREMNAAADVSTREIANINQRLLQMSIGLEVWGDTRVADAVLGYAKVDGVWQLAFREKDSQEPVALVKGGRGLRVAAVVSLPDLLTEITDKLDVLLKELANAKESEKS